MSCFVDGRIFLEEIRLLSERSDGIRQFLWARVQFHRLHQCPLNMDQVLIDLIKESDIPSVVTLINDSYRYEATFKKDPTRIQEPALREMINSRTGRHYIASIPSNHPFYEEIPSLPADGIIGHI